MTGLLEFRRRVYAFMEDNKLSAWAFGRAAANDHHFIKQLKRGRRVREKTKEKVIAFMDQFAANAAKEPEQTARAAGVKPKRGEKHEHSQSQRSRAQARS